MVCIAKDLSPNVLRVEGSVGVSVSDYNERAVARLAPTTGTHDCTMLGLCVSPAVIPGQSWLPGQSGCLCGTAGFSTSAVGQGPAFRLNLCERVPVKTNKNLLSTFRMT